MTVLERKFLNFCQHGYFLQPILICSLCFPRKQLCYSNCKNLHIEQFIFNTLLFFGCFVSQDQCFVSNVSHNELVYFLLQHLAYLDLVIASGLVFYVLFSIGTIGKECFILKGRSGSNGQHLET